MFELHQLVAAGGAQPHSIWWLVLAVVLIATTAPLVFLVGRDGGRPLRR